MLISEKLIFVELQKSGATQVKTLLKKLLDAENEGKQKAVTQEQLDSGRKFVAAVRNPWEWYLSLWADGCLQKGELYERLTNEKKWRKLLEKDSAKPAAEDDAEAAGESEAEAESEAESGETGAAKGKAKTLPANFSPDHAKTFWYADPDNAEAFREWLQAVLVVQPLRKVLDGGYAKSPISKVGGLMTFRYFTQCTKNGETIDKSFATLEALRNYDKENGFIDFFIRNESIVDDTTAALEGCGIELDDEKRQEIAKARKSKASDRPRGPEYYYDEASTQLVLRREKFIIEKFGYKNAKP